MNITLKNLFNDKIMYEDDDFYITLNGEIVVDNRNNIDPNIKEYLDYPIDRINVNINKQAIKIALKCKWSSLGGI